MRALRRRPFGIVISRIRFLSGSDGDGHNHSNVRHQIQHRGTEKVSLALGEKITERMAERISKRIAERGAERISERMAERGAERMAERGAERIAEKVAQRGAQRVAERMAERGAERAMERGGLRLWQRVTDSLIDRIGERGVARLLRGATLAIPVAGTAFAVYLCRSDLLRLRQERGQGGSNRAARWFGVAMFLDGADVLAHSALVYSLASVDAEWHLAHRYSLVSAIGATVCAVVAERLAYVDRKKRE